MIIDTLNSKNIYFIKQNFYKDSSYDDFGIVGFRLDMYVDGIKVGEYISHANYDIQDFPEQSIELNKEFTGQGLGKILVLVGIYQDILTLDGHQEDGRFVSSDLRHVYTSLERDGLISSEGMGIHDVTDKGAELAEKFEVR
jgi:hypothetical protein